MLEVLPIQGLPIQHCSPHATALLGTQSPQTYIARWRFQPRHYRMNRLLCQRKQSRRNQQFYPYSEWIDTERRDRYDESHLWACFCLLALDLTLPLFPQRTL